MRNAYAVSFEKALKSKLRPCPYCNPMAVTPSPIPTATPEPTATPTPTPIPTPTLAPITYLEIYPRVWCKEGDKHFHAIATCEKADNPVSTDYHVAVADGLTYCQTCFLKAPQPELVDSTTIENNSIVWRTLDGKYFHYRDACGDLVDLYPVLLEEAMGDWLDICFDCLMAIDPSVTPSPSPTPEPTPVPTPSPTPTPTPKPTPTPAPTPTVYVYRTSNGKYYHSNTTCSGIIRPSKVELDVAKAEGLLRCKVCGAPE